MLLLAATLLALVWGYYLYYPSLIGPAQPIAFSHRLHVTDKKISCVFCHSGSIDTDRAGVPPLEKCMLCHSRIIVEHPQIKDLRAHYDSGRPVEWEKVTNLRDYAYFSHQSHVRRGFDCGRCHGDVAGMDRVALVRDFQMGFCVQCHRDNGASHDCLTCHR